MRVKNAWEDLPAEIIVTSCKKYCILNVLNGSEDKVIWDAEDLAKRTRTALPTLVMKMMLPWQ